MDVLVRLRRASQYGQPGRKNLPGDHHALVQTDKQLIEALAAEGAACVYIYADEQVVLAGLRRLGLEPSRPGTTFRVRPMPIRFDSIRLGQETALPGEFRLVAVAQEQEGIETYLLLLLYPTGGGEILTRRLSESGILSAAYMYAYAFRAPVREDELEPEELLDEDLTPKGL